MNHNSTKTETINYMYKKSSFAKHHFSLSGCKIWHNLTRMQKTTSYLYAPNFCNKRTIIFCNLYGYRDFDAYHLFANVWRKKRLWKLQRLSDILKVLLGFERFILKQNYHYLHLPVEPTPISLDDSCMSGFFEWIAPLERLIVWDQHF